MNPATCVVILDAPALAVFIQVGEDIRRFGETANRGLGTTHGRADGREHSTQDHAPDADRLNQPVVTVIECTAAVERLWEGEGQKAKCPEDDCKSEEELPAIHVSTSSSDLRAAKLCFDGTYSVYFDL